MEITYELLEEDYVAYNLNHIKHSPSQKKNLLLSRYLLPFVSAFIVYFFGTRIFNQPEIYWVIISFLFIVGWLLYYPKMLEKNIQKQITRLLSEGDNSSFFGVKKMVIGEDSIQIIEGNSSESSISRNNLKEIKVYENQIILYLSAVQGIIIPKRNMDEETQNKLIDALHHFQKSGV